MNDIVGKKFGRLTVLEFDQERTDKVNNGNKFYKCECDCGTIKSIQRSALIGGRTKSCGCMQKDLQRSNFIDLTGQRFGKLTITRKKENDPNDPIKQRRTGAWFFADCDCGTKDVIVKGAYLRAGRVQSCGCYNKEASHIKNSIDLTGQKYGMLTVIEEAQVDKKYGGLYWKCKCDCGNETIVSSNALRTGDTISCGCLSSKNEWKIKSYLDSVGIKYIPQYWFDDLRSPITGWVLKFDVVVIDDNDNIIFIIEYDGEQHEYGMRFSSDP